MARSDKFDFDSAAWLKDPALRSCSAAARGVCMDVICILHQMPTRGIARVKPALQPWSAEDLAAACCGADPSLVSELIRKGVLKVAKRTGTIFYARMVREFKEAKHRERNGKKGGRPPRAGPNRKKTKHKPPSSKVVSENYTSTQEVILLRQFLFSVVGEQEDKTWCVSQSKYQEYVKSFPGVDLEKELRLASQWTRDNPSKRKTPGGMHRFLNSWLTKAQNKLGSQPLFGKPSPPSVDDVFGPQK